MPPRRCPPLFAPLAFPALKRAQRARAAAAILARADADKPLRLRLRLVGVVVSPPRLPNKLLSRLCSASILRRIANACAKLRVDKSIGLSLEYQR